MGFLGAEQRLIDQVADGVFVTGDARRGQSLIVWAIDEGRRTATDVRRELDEKGAFVSIAATAAASTLPRHEEDDERDSR